MCLDGFPFQAVVWVLGGVQGLVFRGATPVALYLAVARHEPVVRRLAACDTAQELGLGALVVPFALRPAPLEAPRLRRLQRIREQF